MQLMHTQRSAGRHVHMTFTTRHSLLIWKMFTLGAMMEWSQRGRSVIGVRPLFLWQIFHLQTMDFAIDGGKIHTLPRIVKIVEFATIRGNLRFATAQIDLEISPNYTFFAPKSSSNSGCECRFRAGFQSCSELTEMVDIVAYKTELTGFHFEYLSIPFRIGVRSRS